MEQVAAAEEQIQAGETELAALADEVRSNVEIVFEIVVQIVR